MCSLKRSACDYTFGRNKSINFRIGLELPFSPFTSLCLSNCLFFCFFHFIFPASLTLYILPHIPHVFSFCSLLIFLIYKCFITQVITFGPKMRGKDILYALVITALAFWEISVQDQALNQVSRELNTDFPYPSWIPWPLSCSVSLCLLLEVHIVEQRLSCGEGDAVAVVKLLGHLPWDVGNSGSSLCTSMCSVLSEQFTLQGMHLQNISEQQLH